MELEVELKARRDEAEQEHLARHQEAVAQTQKYLDDANAELAEVTRRTSEVRSDGEAIEKEMRSEVKAARKDAENSAREIVRSAEDRAAAIIAEAEERTRTLVADAEERLSQIRIEREAVAGYFESLRSVLTQAEQVTADSERRCA
jgi:hypothetical protein